MTRERKASESLWATDLVKRMLPERFPPVRVVEVGTACGRAPADLLPRWIVSNAKLVEQALVKTIPFRPQAILIFMFGPARGQGCVVCLPQCGVVGCFYNPSKSLGPLLQSIPCLLLGCDRSPDCGPVSTRKNQRERETRIIKNNRE